MSAAPLTLAEHAYLARLCVRVGIDKPWYMQTSALRKEFIVAARQYLPHLLALSPPTITRALTISDIVREHGMTPRHWTRLAPTIPGAWQPAGERGKWLFDPIEFARWKASRS